MRSVTSWLLCSSHNSGSHRSGRYGNFASAAYGNANTNWRTRTSAGIPAGYRPIAERTLLREPRGQRPRRIHG
jgi:hypothetical protein